MTARGLASVKHDGSEQRFTKTPPRCLSTSHFHFSANTKLIKYEEQLMERCNSQTKAYIRRLWSLKGRVLLSIEKS